MADPSVRDLIGQGRDLLHRGRPRDALTVFRRAATLDPQSADVHVGLSDALARLGDNAEALAAAERAVALAPETIAPLVALSVSRTLLGNKAGALEAAAAAAAIAPTHPLVLHRLVLARAAAGLDLAALAAAQRARVLRPGDPEAHNLVGLALTRLGHWREAERCFRDALGMDAESYAALNNLGLAAMHQGRHAEADDYLAMAIRDQPGRPTAIATLRANARRRLNRVTTGVISGLAAVSLTAPNEIRPLFLAAVLACIVGRRLIWRRVVGRLPVAPANVVDVNSIRLGPIPRRARKRTP